MKKILLVPFLTLILSPLSGCGNNVDKTKFDNILVVYGGEDSDPYKGEYIKKTLSDIDLNKYKINLDIYSLGSVRNSFYDILSNKISEKNYSNVVIVGEDTFRFTRKLVKEYQGIKFIGFDTKNDEVFGNLFNVNYSYEKLGYLGAKYSLDLTKTNKIGYLSSSYNKFDNYKLYGFLKYIDENNSNVKVFPKYIEEEINLDKTEAYAKKLLDKDVDVIYESISTNNEALINTKFDKAFNIVNGEIDVKALTSTMLNSPSCAVIKDYTKAFEDIFSKISKDEIVYESNYMINDFLVNDGKKIKAAEDLPSFTFNDKEFENLSNKFVISTRNDYSPKESVYSKYHEGIPSCAETNDWKYAPRPGADKGRKPSSWKAIGVWSTIYLQEGFPLMQNTGIEFKNMKIYGYSSTKGWKLIEHANPVGSFYDENFSNDQNYNFQNNMFNDKLTKTTKILLNEKTKGFNYHPFGNQNLLSESGLEDIEYVLSTLDIRLIDWSTQFSSDKKYAKYVANVGADWWVDKGASWKPDWSANRDVCVGQFRTIEEEWKTLYMCSVPPELFDTVLKDTSFLKEDNYEENS